MIKSEHIINKRDFVKRKKVILKRKIIKMLKAYTLRGFSVDEENNTVVCRMSVNRSGMIKEFSKQFTIYYYTKEIPDNSLETTLVLHATTVDA